MLGALRHQAYKTTLLGLLKFECISLYGRIFLARTAPIKQGSQNYLHLGCGDNLIIPQLSGGGAIMSLYISSMLIFSLI